MELVTDKAIEQFFCDVKELLSDDIKTDNQKDLTRSVNDKEGSTRTNIVYLNTDCNLRCEYCYEKDSREGLDDQANCTTEQIDSFLNEIKERESDTNSCIVVMGGEPLLKFDLLEYLIRKAMTMEKPGGWAIPVTTNGMMLLSNTLITKYKKLFDDVSKCSFVSHNIEISFDVSGQYRRKLPDGSNSRPYVEKAITNVIEADFPLRISYTVHKGNYKNIVEDLVFLLEHYPQVERYSISWAFQELDKVGGAQKLKKEIRPYVRHLYERYQTPICDIVCSLCRRCDKSSSVGNSYLSPTEGILYANKETQKSFSQF